jgi:hypothetical protein
MCAGALLSAGAETTVSCGATLRNVGYEKWKIIFFEVPLCLYCSGTISRAKVGREDRNLSLGKRPALLDANGESKISVQGYAVAIIDELEKPSPDRQHFTVEY